MLLSIGILVILVFFPQAAKHGAIEGMRLCASAVIPSLFPFFVAARLLPDFHCKRLPVWFSAFVISLLGGYPIGISRLCTMYEKGRISKQTAQQAIAFCNNSGPGFFIAMVGGVVLQDATKGLILYLIHVLSAVICACIFTPQKGEYALKRIATTQTDFLSSVSGACEAMLTISGLVILFSVLISIVSAMPFLSNLPHEAKALMFGVLELTSGIAMARESFVLCAFLTGWGGLCVHMQGMALWKKCSLKPRHYFFAKMLHGVLSAIFAYAYLLGGIHLLFISGLSTILFVLLRNFLKNGLAKRKNLLYNTYQR